MGTQQKHTVFCHAGRVRSVPKAPPRTEAASGSGKTAHTQGTDGPAEEGREEGKGGGVDRRRHCTAQGRATAHPGLEEAAERHRQVSWGARGRPLKEGQSTTSHRYLKGSSDDAATKKHCQGTMAIHLFFLSFFCAPPPIKWCARRLPMSPVGRGAGPAWRYVFSIDIVLHLSD